MSTTPSTGPRTDEGKSISSKNATTTGLYTASDHILSEEQSLYADLENSVIAELAPEGPIESHLAEEILAAMWRLRRCRQLEAGLTIQPQPETDHEKRQQSIDRARNQSTRLLHKNTAELRRIQTERLYRREISADGIEVPSLGVCDVHTAFSNADRAIKNMERHPIDQINLKLETLTLESKLQSANAPAAGPCENPGGVRFVNSGGVRATAEPQPSREIARGALCPCNSGKKYKRCCGKTAPPLLHRSVRAA